MGEHWMQEVAMDSSVKSVVKTGEDEPRITRMARMRRMRGSVVRGASPLAIGSWLPHNFGQFHWFSFPMLSTRLPDRSLRVFAATFVFTVCLAGLAMAQQPAPAPATAPAAPRPKEI